EGRPARRGRGCAHRRPRVVRGVARDRGALARGRVRRNARRDPGAREAAPVTGAVVLAAGASSRMGRDKAALPLPDGRTCLDAIRQTLSVVGIDAVRVVVSGTDSRSETVPDTFVVNPDPSRGMLSSVQCGLSALPGDTDAVLIWPVDHPRVGLGTVAMI